MRSDTHLVKLTRAPPRTATIVGMERGPFVTLASAGVHPPRRRTSVSPRALGVGGEPAGSAGHRIPLETSPLGPPTLPNSLINVEGLSQAEQDRIALYMNYDMVGSPNYIFMVYDADESTFEAPVAVPAGSREIEDIYESYYTAIGEPYNGTEFSGRSDYEAFILAGIPSSGLFRCGGNQDR